MCSHSQINISTVTNDVTVVDNNFTEAQWTPNNGNIWYNMMSSEPNQIYQTQQWFLQTPGLNVNIRQQPEEPSPYFQNVIGGVPASSNIPYQEYNRHCISQPYSSNQGNVTAQNPLQVQSIQRMVPCHFMGNQQCISSTYPKPNRSQTNYVQTKTGLKAVTKRKRKRTMFTTEQVAVLEKVFLSKPYVNREERQALVEELQINDRVIKVWFQNRRLKEKREAEEAAQELYSPDTEDTEAHQFDELTYIESQIHQTDNSGFVTLDDRAMNGLVSVIDNLFKETQLDLSEENQGNESPNGPQEESESVTIYEPISPASSDNTSSDGSTSYQPFEPKESLQRIFDIQEFLVFNKTTV